MNKSNKQKYFFSSEKQSKIKLKFKVFYGQGVFPII